MTNQSIIKGSVAAGIINAIINGLINWFQLDQTKTYNLTTNLISSQEHTVFGGAVILGTSLAFILTSIAYLTAKIEMKPSYFPKVLLLALKNSVFAFGVITIFALLLQKMFGTIEVNAVNSALITGSIAGLVAMLVEYATKNSLLKK
jgi:branched-subunit amino acid transport protein